MSEKPRILRPTADPAERAILVGDPGRALLLATELLEAPAPMFNHHRGLWGYCGPSAAGRGRLLIQGTGVGGPSIGAVVTDLALLGVRRMVRLGTATSAALPTNSVVIADAATTKGPGTSPGSAGLLSTATTLLADSHVGSVISDDVHLPPTQEAIPAPALAADLSTGTLYSLASDLGLEALSVLVVAETAARHISDAELEATFKAIAPAAREILA